MDNDDFEDRRLRALRDYAIMDTAPEEPFDRITRIVAAALKVPMAAVTLVDDHRQWFKARIGLVASETPRSESFCAQTMMGADAMVISDATQDPRFEKNALVLGDPHIRFYAGYPVVSADGMPMGAVCAIDTAPRTAEPRELELLKDLAALAGEQLELRLRASLDGLTGVLRRNTFLDMASRELLLARRSKAPTSCLMVDVDHFKPINDAHGHEVGDDVLKTLVRTLKNGLRSTDLIGRLGGEEFGILLPGTDRDGAAEVAERIRNAVAGLKIMASCMRVDVTVSIGVAQGPTSLVDIGVLLDQADKALFSAKRTGRNRIASAPYPDLAAAM